MTDRDRLTTILAQAFPGHFNYEYREAVSSLIDAGVTMPKTNPELKLCGRVTRHVAMHGRKYCRLTEGHYGGCY